MDFDVHADALSAAVDTHCGDSIMYGVDGGAMVAMKARVLNTEQPGTATFGAGRIDEARGHWQLRIAKSLVANPSKNDRLQCVRILGADTYRPSGKDPISDGRYWLVDLQKV